MKNKLSFLTFVLILLLNACSTETRTPPVTVETPKKPADPTIILPPSSPALPNLKATEWSELAGWSNNEFMPAWEAFLKSCATLGKQPLWQKSCTAAVSITQPDNATLREFFEKSFVPYQILNADGSNEGLVTGYYEPLLQGSRKPSERYRFPLYTAPDELLVIDLGAVYPEIENMKLRGRLHGRNVVPFYSRAELMNNPEILSGYEFLWVDDEVELFFLQIQGSGRIELENGEILKIGYAEHNGHPYRSIGKLLVQKANYRWKKLQCRESNSGANKIRKNSTIYSSKIHASFSFASCPTIFLAHWVHWVFHLRQAEVSPLIHAPRRWAHPFSLPQPGPTQTNRCNA